MNAIREVLTVKDGRVTIKLPDNFEAKQVEVIVRAADEHRRPTTAVSNPESRRRRPSPLLAGTRIVGDIMSPVVEATEWNALT